MSLSKLSGGSPLLQRSVVAVSWNVVAHSAAAAILFVRSVILARLLPVEVFGIYAGATTIVGLTSILPSWGMAGAFLNRVAETADEEKAAANYFTLQLLLTTVWAAIVVIATLLLTDGPMRAALLVLTATYGAVQLTDIPNTILVRRVIHRRLALLKIVLAVATTVAAVTLAWLGATLWAILSTEVVTAFVTVATLYLWQPVWRPRWDWHPPIIRYYLRYGSRNLIAYLLEVLLHRLDNLWTQFFLGVTALGYYSRAYTFATYPRQLLAMPISIVAGGTYAELKGDRQRLSKAFFRTNALLVRSGFLFAGLFALIAPEFILLLLGEKWLPMLNIFRLMLVFTLLDPIRDTIASLFIVVGQPEKLLQIRLGQVALLLLSFYILTQQWQVIGVALGMNIMIFVGVTTMLYAARQHVDFAWRKLFGPPLIGLILALGGGAGLLALLPVTLNAWQTLMVKGGLFFLIYGGVIWLLEQQELMDLINTIRKRS